MKRFHDRVILNSFALQIATKYECSGPTYKRNLMIAIGKSSISEVKFEFRQKRRIQEGSWAQELLKKYEKIEPQENQNAIIVTREILANPPEKVKRLVDEMVNLNMLEMNQLMKYLQVNKAKALSTT